MLTESVTAILNYALKGEQLDQALISEDFTQIINGEKVALDDFHQRTAALRKEHKVIELSILSMATSLYSVHSHHLVKTINDKNQESRYEVFSRFDFYDGKAVRCYESLRELGKSDAVAVFF